MSTSFTNTTASNVTAGEKATFRSNIGITEAGDALVTADDAAAQRTALGVGNVFNAKQYGATGDSTQTTGSVSAASSALTVADASSFTVGDGIFVAGAGTSGGRFVSTVSGIAGNVITLADPAVTTVSGALVQHDDSAAINAALAAARSAGGGTVHLPAGHYRCNGYLDPTTGSILTIEPILGYTTSPISVHLIGEVRGRLNASMTDVLSGGVVIDSRHSTETTGRKSVFAASAYVEYPTFGNIDTEWNNMEVNVDGILFVLAPNPSLDGLMFKNTTRFSVGDDLMVVALCATAGPSLLEPGFAEPTWNTYGTVGIWFPTGLNNVQLNCGSCIVFGFGQGIAAGEHMILSRPYIGWCHVGLLIPVNNSHLIAGHISIENCAVEIQISGAANVDLTLQDEATELTGKWWNRQATVLDTANQGRGIIRVCGFDKALGGSSVPELSGAANLSIYDIRTGLMYGGIKAVIPTYADDSAAGVGGLTAGSFYKTSGGVMMIKL